jgi:uncharacterized short protein YbdD (DUF466 family)
MPDNKDGGSGKREGAPPLPSRIARVVRRIVGAPDYDVYLEHCRRAGHEVRLTERQFIQEFFETRKSVRCC